MTAITQIGCPEGTAPRGLHRAAISVGLGLVQWGRKRTGLRGSRPSYDEQLRRIDEARTALVWSGQSGRG